MRPCQAGPNPYKHKVYDAFCPVFPAQALGGAAGEEGATNANKPGRVVNSYTGKGCARSTGVNRLAEMFTNGKVQCTTEALRHQAGLDALIAVLKAKRGQTGQAAADKLAHTGAGAVAAAGPHHSSASSAGPNRHQHPPAGTLPPKPIFGRQCNVTLQYPSGIAILSIYI